MVSGAAGNRTRANYQAKQVTTCGYRPVRGVSWRLVTCSYASDVDRVHT